MRRFIPDRITLGLIIILVIASVFPCSGNVYELFSQATDIAVALLFFLHGLKLSRQAAWEGLIHWKLHGVVLAFTFVFFPLLGLALKPILIPLIGHPLYLGFLFLCVTPSTVQSSIAFTAIAKGNVAAAVCAASLSSILGIFLTPLLTGILIFSQNGGNVSLDAIGKILLLLLFPFILGQCLRPCLGTWIQKNKALVSYVDQLSILLIVYTAFSHAVTSGLWDEVPLKTLLILGIICSSVLALVLWLTYATARFLHFNRADTIAIMFCGSKKSLASGVPMLKVLLITQPLGALILPLMIFHQLQLMTCAYISEKMRKDSSNLS